MNKFILIASVAVLALSATESWATITCEFTSVGNGKYSLSVSSDTSNAEFTSSSCDNYLSQTDYSDWYTAKKKITTVTFDDNITSIGNYAFGGSQSEKNDYNLTTVIMPNVKNIGYAAFQYAFAHDGSEPNLYTPNVENIGDNAFYQAFYLRNIDLPNLKTIGNKAFMNSNNLSSVGMPTTYIDDNGETQQIDVPSNAFFTEYGTPGNIRVMNNCTTDSETGYKVCGTCGTTSYPGAIVPGYGCVSTCNYNGIPAGVPSGNDYVPDTVTRRCTKLTEGCTSVSRGICTCESGYLSNGSGTCMSESSCKNGFHVANNACVANSDANCNTEVGGKCAECKGGYLEQDGDCVTSCGESYRNMGTFCNKVRWTPAEAAAVLRDDDTNVVTITFKLQ